MKNKLVSVVIPTYKRPDMIARAVNSVLKQTYENIEIIVVDDNSPQTVERMKTEEVMSKYENYENIIYLKHERNKNGSAARNTGWKASKGYYITFVDDDDELSPQKIEKQVECLNLLDESWGACYTAYKIIMKNGMIQHSRTNQSGNVYLRALMRTLYMGSGSNVMLRKQVVDEIGGYDEDFIRNQDIEFMARAFEKYKVAYIPEELLTIHMEVRAIKRSFEMIDGVTIFYLNKMKDRINKLNKEDCHKVKAVIALDRARVAIYHKKYLTSIKLLIESQVRIGECIKYIMYLVRRIITKQSYGFYL